MSEDPSIEVFRPHRRGDEAFVWAVDTRHLPLFWFPRDCPRATFWADTKTTEADVACFLCGARDRRVHAIESSWLDRMRSARVLAYRLPETTFQPHPKVGGYWVSCRTVVPLGVVELSDPLGRHAQALIELRIAPSVWPLWDAVVASTLAFSGIRLRNAQQP